MSDAKNVATQAQGAVSRPNDGPMKYDRAVSLLKNYTDKINDMAPKNGLKAERLMSMCALAITSNEKLATCSPASIVAAVMQCAIAGLNPSRGECYLVPYGQNVQMQVGYRGALILAYKSGIVSSITSEAVYEGDHFVYEMGLNPRLEHRAGPNFGIADKVTHSYCIVRMKGGSECWKVLTKPMIERLRMKSPMQKNGLNGPWATDYDKMACAKAIKQVINMLPKEDEWRSYDFIDESVARAEHLEDMHRGVPLQPEYPEVEIGPITNTEP